MYLLTCPLPGHCAESPSLGRASLIPGCLFFFSCGSGDGIQALAHLGTVGWGWGDCSETVVSLACPGWPCPPPKRLQGTVEPGSYPSAVVHTAISCTVGGILPWGCPPHHFHLPCGALHIQPWDGGLVRELPQLSPRMVMAPASELTHFVTIAITQIK